jgi:hypothetical protein
MRLIENKAVVVNGMNDTFSLSVDLSLLYDCVDRLTIFFHDPIVAVPSFPFLPMNGFETGIYI